MASVYGKIKGLVNWAKVYEPDVAFGDSKWKVDFYPLDKEQWAIVDKLELTMRRREDPELDMEFIKLSRPTEKKIQKNYVTFNPIRIFNKDGSMIQDTLDANGAVLKSYDTDNPQPMTSIGERVLLGNGTEVEVTLVVYDTQVGKGHRIEEIRVLDLVHYDAEAETSDIPESDIEGSDTPAWETA